MQRRMKLIRKILQYVSDCDTEDPLRPPEFEDYSEAQVHYHLNLCEEAGYLLLERRGRCANHRRVSGIYRLTWQGHEALERLCQGCSQ